MKNFLKLLGTILAIPFAIINTLGKLVLLFTVVLIVALLTGEFDIYRRNIMFSKFVITDAIKQLKQNNKLTFYQEFVFHTSSNKNMVLTKGFKDNEPIYEINEQEFEQKS